MANKKAKEVVKDVKVAKPEKVEQQSGDWEVLGSNKEILSCKKIPAKLLALLKKLKNLVDGKLHKDGKVLITTAALLDKEGKEVPGYAVWNIPEVVKVKKEEDIPLDFFTTMEETEEFAKTLIK